MKRFITVSCVIVLLAVACVSAVCTALAQAGNGYDLSWWTVDGGGHTFSGGGAYSLGGTVGPPETGSLLIGGRYAVTGGFWSCTAALAGQRLYLPVVLKNYG